MSRTGVTRREFLAAAAGCGVVLGCPAILRAERPGGWLPAFAGPARDPAAPEGIREILRQAPVARHWVSAASPGVPCVSCHAPSEIAGGKTHAHEGTPVRCLLCAHRCRIPEGERGRCRARVNVKGELRSLVYGRPITEHLDPIEKKPFYHFLPGAAAFSFATSGCPFRCRFCQNWEISQARPEDYVTRIRGPEEMAGAAARQRAAVVAFTYNEPTVFFEYLVDTARAARNAGLRPVIISCGFMNEEPLRELIEVLDGIKIDLKGFSEGFYRDVSGAELKPVLRSIRQVAKAGRHLEIVNLVVPTLNDSEPMLRELSKWVVGETGPDTPVHFTRFHPDYQLLNLPPTAVATLERAREIAMSAGIRYAYVGNVPGHPGNHTYCPSCRRPVIERSGLFVQANRLVAGACPACRAKIAGVWS